LSFQNDFLIFFVIIGFLGSFTTFSGFSFETLQLFQLGAIAPALLNVLLNISLCLAAVWPGKLLVVH
jgi:fluoride exporter